MGKEKDTESGLYYYGARYYSAWTCRFISVDPLIGQTFYQSSFAYADNNPVMMNDPTGMKSENGGENEPKNFDERTIGSSTYSYVDGVWHLNAVINGNETTEAISNLNGDAVLFTKENANKLIEQLGIETEYEKAHIQFTFGMLNYLENMGIGLYDMLKMASEGENPLAPLLPMDDTFCPTGDCSASEEWFANIHTMVNMALEEYGLKINAAAEGDFFAMGQLAAELALLALELAEVRALSQAGKVARLSKIKYIDEAGNLKSIVNKIDNVGVARTGTTKKVITEIRLDDLLPLHPVPRSGMPANHIENLAQSIKTTGYDVKQAIPILKLPNGKLVSAGGHHRVAAMKSLGESTIPSRVVEWSSLSKASKETHLNAHYGRTLQRYLNQH